MSYSNKCEVQFNLNVLIPVSAQNPSNKATAVQSEIEI